MEQLRSTIPVAFSDPAINALLKEAGSGDRSYRRHFTQNEEFMLRLDDEYDVGSCPIHHDVRTKTPLPEYRQYLKRVMEQLVRRLPSVFTGLTHIFDPGEIFRPQFFRLYRLNSQQYLYLVRLDLHYRPTAHTAGDRGGNDRTTAYRTNSVILESDFVPLSEVETEASKVRGFVVEQSVSQTWIGETGRGYFIQGIWLDRELTRFFSKLFTPPGVRPYPYYLFTCKYQAICHSVITLDETARKRTLPLLHKARAFLLPHLREIESALKEDEIRVEKNPTFVRLKQEIPAFWNDIWKDFSIRLYLNEEDQKEYEIHHGIF